VKHHLSEYYIRYLLATDGLTEDKDWFTRKLSALSLPPVDEETLADIRSTFMQPRFFLPTDSTNRESMRFLRSQRVYRLFYPDRDVHAAQDLLYDRYLRDRVETALLGRHDPVQVARIVNKATGSKLKGSVLSLFRHFWFNVSFFTNEQLSTILYDHDTGWKASNWSQKKAALWGGPEVAAIRAGVKRRLDSREVMTKVQEILYCNFLEADRWSLSPKKVMMLGELARGLIMVDERLSAGDAAIQEVLERFQQFRMKHRKREVPGKESLGGRFSGSGETIAELGPAKEGEEDA